MSPTPFEVTADQVTVLGPRFGTFVNRLLDVERASQGLPGDALTITANENARDGGVDAALRGSIGTTWAPPGDVVFQFKRSSYTAAACAAELESAERAKALLRAGAHYVIALGGDNLSEPGVQDRIDALVNRALALGLIDESGTSRLHVYDANAIGRWASDFPSLAIHPVLQGVQLGAIDFERWRASREHQGEYSADDLRTEQIEDIRRRLASGDPSDIRLQGDSGIGKTRLAMETLDDDRFRTLVAYIDDDSRTGQGLIESLIDRGRAAIVVVDECPADRHVKLNAKLPKNPGVKLITIGDAGSSRSSGPVVGLQPLADEAMDTLLLGATPALGNEARRFVIDHSHGAPAWALFLAQAVQRTPDAQAGDVIARGDIEHFITTYLPEGADFFFAAVLALFERIGWDRDLRPQAEMLAAFAGAKVSDLDKTLLELSSHGLARAHGRYRSIGPMPVAIYLAAEGWRLYGQRIVDELLSQLDGEMALALFRRVAQLGRFEPAQSVLPSLLSPSGPFPSLEAIDQGDRGALLTQLAIVLPDEVVDYLTLLIDDVEIDALRQMRRSRRDLVWTLEKLAWHSRTFEKAADALLKLALAENETYANNATGTWVDLFGAVLPGTAASPAQRLNVLSRCARDTRSEVRALVIQAASRGLDVYESITVSGEIQGGVLVEPRGTPQTLDELADYRRGLIRLLDELRSDGDDGVARASVKALLDCLHRLVDDPQVGANLLDVLASLEGTAREELHAQVEQLISLYSRRSAEDRDLRAPLEAFRERLGPLDAAGELKVLLRLQRWDLPDGELERRIVEAVGSLSDSERDGVIEMLEPRARTAWDVGRGLARAEGRSERWMLRATREFDTNPDLLVGFLSGLVDLGHEDAFDRYLESDLARELATEHQLAIAVRGPLTDQSRRLVSDNIRRVPLMSAIRTTAGWGRLVSSDELAPVLADWIGRVQSQDEYNAIVDWTNLIVHGREIDASVSDLVWPLVALRASFPSLGREEWDWARLAERTLPDHSEALLSVVLGLIEAGDVMVHAGDDEASLVGACLARDPVRGWAEIAQRLGSPNGWRISMQLRGWIQHAVPTDVVNEWIGHDLSRARLVASVVHPGGARPSELAVLLLEQFGDDPQVSSALAAAFASGSWVGAWSNRIQGQIDELSEWLSNRALAGAVRRWAAQMIASLRSELAAVRQREAEGDY